MSERPVVLYASDHGFGHAMRMLPLAEALRARGLSVLFCAGAALGAARPTLARIGAAAAAASLDVGLASAADRPAIDEARSREAVRGWLRRLPSLIEEEAARLRAAGARLVIADAPAAAVAAGARAGVPAVVCSNFSWLDLYGEAYGADVADALATCYGHARLGLRLSPGRMPLGGVPRRRDVAGLLGRRRRRGRSEVRAALGIPPEQPVLGLGLGRSLGPEAFAALAAGLRPGPVRLLAPAGCLPLEAGAAEYPPDHPDPQDFLCAADAVLGKAGYGTIAECALGGVPLLLLTIDGNPESRALADEAAALGLAAPVDLAEARRLLHHPEEALRRVSGLRPALPPAAPAIVELLAGEGLL